MADRVSYAHATTCGGYTIRTLTKIGTVTRGRFRRSLLRTSRGLGGLMDCPLIQYCPSGAIRSSAVGYFLSGATE
jgi:hypothetical protein